MEERQRCAICGEDAAGHGVLIEGMALCAWHMEEAGRLDWQSIGYYRRDVMAEHRRDILEKEGIRSLLLKSGSPSGMILMVAGQEYDRAQKALDDHQELFAYCPVCNIEYSAHEVFCPWDGQTGVKKSPEDRN